MDIRQITPRYFVAPQISVEDVSQLPALGFTCLICNRPDVEIPPSHQAAAMQAAAEAAGLTFVINPLTHDTMTEDRLSVQRQALEGSEGKVLAYCASGTRSTVAWVLGHADSVSADELLMAATQGGYQLEALRPRIDAIAAQTKG
jgi:uncharacterized protein (TIGR01244 family)